MLVRRIKGYKASCDLESQAGAKGRPLPPLILFELLLNLRNCALKVLPDPVGRHKMRIAHADFRCELGGQDVFERIPLRGIDR